MPSQVAFLATLSFIFAVIYIEHKNSEGLSGLVWIIAVWILYSVSKGLGFFLNIQTTIETGSPPDKYFQVLLSVLSTIIIIKRHFPVASAIKQNAIATIIIFYSLLSVVWTKEPGISFRRWGREAIALIIALLLSSEKSPIKTLTSAMRKAIYAALPLSLLLIKYFPKYGRSYGRWSGEEMWEGIASQKNGLAILCAISILFMIWSIAQNIKKWKRLSSKLPVFIDIFMILLALYLMMGPRRTLTYSATSLLSLIIGIITMLSYKAFTKRGMGVEKQIMLIAIIIMAIGILMPFSGKIPIKALPKMINRGDTLTGRTEIWNALIPYAKKHILLGHGFGGFWTTSLRNQISSHAHNGYLDTILEIGVIGLALFILFILIIIKKSSVSPNKDASYFFMALIIMILSRNIAESTFGEFISYPIWLLLAWSFIMIKKDDIIMNKNKELAMD